MVKNQKVDIEELSIEQLDNNKNKLSNAAIELIIDISPVKTNIDTNNHTEIIYDMPYKDIEKCKLEEYSKLIKKKIYMILDLK